MPKSTGTGKPPTFTRLSPKSSSSSSLLKIADSPKFQRASTRDFSDDDEDLSLVEDLSENKEKYKAQPGETTTVTVFAFSPIVRLNIDRIQARVPYKPSRNLIVSACIRRSVIALRKDPRITGLVNVRTRYKLADSGIDPYINLIIGNLVNSLPLPCASGGKNVNIAVPRDICGMLSDLANDIGMSNSSVTLLSIMMPLSEQEETVKANAEEFYGYVREFFKSIGARVQACGVLLEAYGL